MIRYCDKMKGKGVPKDTHRAKTNIHSQKITDCPSIWHCNSNMELKKYIYLFIYLSTYSSIYLSIYPIFIYLSIYLPIYLYLLFLPGPFLPYPPPTLSSPFIHLPLPPLSLSLIPSLSIYLSVLPLSFPPPLSLPIPPNLLSPFMYLSIFVSPYLLPVIILFILSLSRIV